MGYGVKTRTQESSASITALRLSLAVFRPGESGERERVESRAEGERTTK